MIDWIDHALRMIDLQLGMPTAVRALVVGLVCSWGLTQLLKFLPHLAAFGDHAFRWSVRVLAFCLGALPTWALWPEAGSAGVWMALAVGIMAPTAYTVGVRTVAHFWPWMSDRVSARPTSNAP
jgi:hypothetical protein